MDDAAREAYVEEAVARFGETLSRAMGLSEEKAATSAREHLAEILPDRGNTPGHQFRHVVADGAVIGAVWFAEQPPDLYLYDIHLQDDARGGGHGSAALAALESEARAIGAQKIILSVFEHNEGAIRLYERLGYQTDEQGAHGRRMSKQL